MSLLDGVEEAARRKPDPWEARLLQHAEKDMTATDPRGLRRMVEVHHDLLHRSDRDASCGSTLLGAPS